MNWHEVAGPLFACLGVIFAAFIGGLFGHIAARKSAEVNNQDAFTRAYQAASDNWARYTEAMQKWCETQSAELSKLAHRQTQTDMALEAERMRANKNERLYATAIIYLRRIASWINENWPGVTLPPPPPEIEADLDGHAG